MQGAAHYIDGFTLFVFTAALIAAAVSDARTYLIPNRYSAAILLAFALYAVGKPMPVWIDGVLAALLCFAAGVLLFERGMLGGGDVKLLTAAALWAGFEQMALLLFTTAVAGGALALAHLSPLHRYMPARPGEVALAGGIRARLHQSIPFGVAIALGGLCVALTRLSH